MKTLTKLFTTLAIALGLASAASAATPVAVWDGDFPENGVASQDFTLTYNGNTRATDGAKITIADTMGLGVTFAKSGMAATTVAVRYSNWTGSSSAKQTIGTFSAANVDNRVGIHRYEDGTVYGSHSAGNLAVKESGTGTFNGSTEADTLFLRYSSNGVSLFDKSGTEIYRKPGYKWGTDFSGNAVTAFTVGGACSSTFCSLTAATGMEILGVAVFSSELSSADMAAYQFPSEEEVDDNLEIVTSTPEEGKMGVATTYGTLSTTETITGTVGAEADTLYRPNCATKSDWTGCFHKFDSVGHTLAANGVGLVVNAQLQSPKTPTWYWQVRVPVNLRNYSIQVVKICPQVFACSGTGGVQNDSALVEKTFVSIVKDGETIDCGSVVTSVIGNSKSDPNVNCIELDEPITLTGSFEIIVKTQTEDSGHDCAGTYGGLAGIVFYQPPKEFTATMATDKNFSELEWTPTKPTEGFNDKCVLTITNTAAAKLTFDSALTAKTIKIANAAGNALGMAFDESVTAAWDFSEAAGGISFASLTGTDLAKNAVAGAPYSYWAIKGTITGTPTVTGPTMPNGYTVTSETLENYGVRLIVTAPVTAQFGSISVNLSGKGYTVSEDATLHGAHPIAGTAWNNFRPNSASTASSIKEVAADGTVTTGSVTFQNHDAHEYDTLNSETLTILRGYHDDGGASEFTFANIPFSKYRVIVYYGTDNSDVGFAAAQIGVSSSATTYYYGPALEGNAGVTVSGTSAVAWGNTNIRSTLVEGHNYVVSDVLEGTGAYIKSTKAAPNRATVAAIQIVEVGSYVDQFDFTANITAATSTWGGGTGTGLSGQNGTWENSAKNTITLTNTVASTFTIDQAITALKFSIASESGKAVTIPQSGLANLADVASLDFSNAAGGVKIDCTGLTAAEGRFFAKTIVGYANVSGVNAPSGYAMVAKADGLYLYKTDTGSRNNPVTGTAQSFTHAYVGEDGAWTTLTNWRTISDGVLMPYTQSNVPMVQDSGVWVPTLVDGALFENHTVSVATIEGYNAQLAVMGGAQVTISTLRKSGGDNCWYWVGTDSRLTISAFGDQSFGMDFSFYVAGAEGLVFSSELESSHNKGYRTYNYYLKGLGSVNYAAGVTAGTHKIKQFQLVMGTGSNKIITRQPLVTFAEKTGTPTFTIEYTAVSTDTGDTATQLEQEPTLDDGFGSYFVEQTETGVYVIFVGRTDKTELTWDNANKVWKNRAGETVTPDSNSILTVADGDEITFGSAVTPYAVNMPISGTVTFADQNNLTISSIEIPSGATLAMTANAAPSFAVTGTGVLKYAPAGEKVDATEVPVEQLSGFTGTFWLKSGRHEYSSAIASTVRVKVTDGATICLYGDTWNNAFEISGQGWKNDENNSMIEYCAVRFSANATIGSSASFAFAMENDLVPAIGNHSDTVAIPCTLTGCGFKKYGTGTIRLDNPLTQCTSLTGTNVVSYGTMQLGNTGPNTDVSNATLKIGDAIKIDSGATLHYALGRHATFTIDNDIVLNGGKISNVNGTFVFKKVDVLASSQYVPQYEPIHTFQNLTGKAGTTFTLHSTSTGYGAGHFVIAGGDYAGEIYAYADGGSGTFKTLGTAAESATIKIGNNMKIVVTEDATVGSLNNCSCAIEGSDTSTLTIKGGSASGVISGENTSVNIAGAVTLSANNTFLGALTVQNGGTLKMGDKTCLNGNSEVTVQTGGALDVNGKADHGIKVTLAGGKLINNGSVLDSGSMCMASLTVTANSEIDVANNWGFVASGYYAATLTLGANTLTKKGSANFDLVSTTVSGSGKIVIDAGSLTVASRGKTGVSIADGTIEINAGTLTIDSGKTLTLKGLTVNGGTISNSGTISGLATLNGDIDFGNIGGTIAFSNEVTIASGTTTLSSTAATAIGSKTVTVSDGATLNIDSQRNVAFTSLAGTVKAVLTSAETEGEETSLTLFTATTTAGTVTVSVTDAQGREYDVTEAGGTYTVDPTSPKAVAKIGETEYATVAEAFENVTDGQTVMLLADRTETLTATNAFTLALDDHTLGGSLEIDENAAVTLTYGTNGSLSSVVTGSGTLVCDGYLPDSTLQTSLKEDTWTGTVWLKNKTVEPFGFNNYCNSGSKIKLTGITGYGEENGTLNAAELILEDENTTVALTINNGFSKKYYQISKLSGTGTLKSQTGTAQDYVISDGSAFAGSIDLETQDGVVVIFGDTSTGSNSQGLIQVDAGKEVAIASGKTWQAHSGITVNGTLTNNGTLTGTLKGSGTFIYDGAKVTSFPAAPSGVAATDWTGTLWLKGYQLNGSNLMDYGNAGSKVKMSMCSGYLNGASGASLTHPFTLVLANDGGDYGLNVNNGNSNQYMAFGGLEGDGTLKMTRPSGQPTVQYIFKEASNFTGSIDNSAAYGLMSVVLDAGDAFTPDYSNYQGKILALGTTTVASGKTWNGRVGIVVNGTINNNGTLTGTVSGSGIVVYDGKVPGDEKSGYAASGWTGTVWIKNYTQAGQIFNEFGNANSKIRFTGVKGWFHWNTTATTLPVELVDDGDTRALEITDGSLNKNYSFVKISGDGSFNVSSVHTDGFVVQIKDASDYTGKLTSLASTTPSAEATKPFPIYVGEGTPTYGDKSKITVADGATIHSGCGWEAAAVEFGATLTVKGVAGDTIVCGITTAPTLDTLVTLKDPSTGAVIGEYSLVYDNGAVKVDAAAIPRIGWDSTQSAWTNGQGTVVESLDGKILAAKNGDVITFGASASPKSLVMPTTGTVKITDPSNLVLDKLEIPADATLKLGDGKLTTPVTGTGTVVVDGSTGTELTSISSGIKVEVAAGVLKMTTISLDAGETLKIAKDAKIELANVPTFAASSTIEITDASSLVAGNNYALMTWTNWPNADLLGYGKPQLTANGYAGAEIRLVPGIYGLTLQCRSAAQVARKPLVIMPIGDSITEGLNNKDGSGKNYRIPLFNKLSLAGYNVKSVGFWKNNGGASNGSYDPSGTVITDTNLIYHCGKGSMRAGALSGNGMVFDALLNDIDIAGHPDIVLLHIGINDMLNNGSYNDTNGTNTYAYLTNMITRAVNAHPEVTFVISSPMCCEYGHDCQTRTTKDATTGTDKNKEFVTPVHTMMTNFFAKARAGEIDGLTQAAAQKIYFADMYANVMPRWYGDEPDTFLNDGSDHCHPNWLGHEKMAETWFTQITNAFTDVTNPNGHYDANPAAIPETALHATNNVPAAYRDGYVLARVYRPGPTDRLNDVITGKQAIPYEYVNPDIPDDTRIARVAYFFEYVRPTATTNLHRYVWADMGAFDTTAVQVGVPTNNHHAVVNNFHVYGNHPAVWNIDADDNTQKGFVEFTPYGVSSSSAGVAGGPAKWCNYSWNDAFGDTLVYGCMQVHRMIDGGDMGREAQVVFAYNAFTSETTYPGYDFGIGNFSQSFMPQSMDWTFMQRTETMSSTNLTYRSIEIWVMKVHEYSATMTGSQNWSDLFWTPAGGGDPVTSANLPVSATLSLDISGDSTLTFDTAVNVTSLSVTNSTGAATLALVNNTGSKTPGIGEFAIAPTIGSLAVDFPFGTSYAIPTDGTLTLTVKEGDDYTYSGVISGEGKLVKAGAGVLTLNAGNTYTGGTEVQAGGIVFGSQDGDNPGPIGPFKNDTTTWTTNATVFSGAFIDINGKANMTYVIELKDGATLKNASTDGIGDNNRETKAVFLSGNATVDASAALGIHNGNHNSSKLDLGTNTLTKTGSGTFNLVNTTVSGTGKVLVNAGTLRIVSKASDFGNATLEIANGGTLNVDGQTLTVKNLTNNGTISNSGTISGLTTLNGTVDTTAGGTWAFANEVTVASGTTTLNKTTAAALGGKTATVNADATLAFNVGENDTIDFTGTLAGNGAITKTGAGTLVFNNGTNRAFPAIVGNITVSEGAVSYKITETPQEYGYGSIRVTGLPAGATLTVERADGTAMNLTASAEGTVTYEHDPIVSGAATIFDVTFTNKEDASQFAYKAVSGATLQYDSTATFYDPDKEIKDRGVYIKHHPYINEAASTFYGLTDFTTVVVGQMSPSNNTQFIHFGSCTGSNPGLLIATTENKDEVVVLRNAGTTLTEIKRLSVPNAATARHVYIITKKDVAATDQKAAHSVFTVYLDGVKKATVPMDGIFKLGASGHSGVQVGSSFGGTLNSGTYKSVAASDAGQTGYISVLRVYDYLLADAQATALTDEYPYESQGGLFLRDVEGAVNYAAENTWTKSGEATATYEVPTGADGFKPSATLEATAAATVTVNTNSTIDVFTFNGKAMSFVKDAGGTNAISISTAVINAPVSIEYGSVDLKGATVSLNSSGSLAFDFSGLDLRDYFTTTKIQVTGLTEQNDEKITATLPTAAYGRTTSFAFEGTAEGGEYYLTVTVDAATPFIFTIAAEAETGIWTFGEGGEEVTQAIVDANPTIPVWKKGDGAMTNVVINRTYFVKEGTMVAGEAANKTGTVTVDAGATFDFNGKKDGYTTINLNGGSLVNNGEEMGTGSRQIEGIALTANSTVGGKSTFGMSSNSHNANSLDLGGFTLTKQGTNTFFLCNTTVTNGTVVVSDGVLAVSGTGSETATFVDAGLNLGEKATLRVDGSKTLTIGAITGTAGAAIQNSGTISAFTLTGAAKLDGSGTYGTVTLAENAVADIGTRRNLTFAGAGKVNVTLTAAEDKYNQKTDALFTRAAESTATIGTVTDSKGNTIPSAQIVVDDTKITIIPLPTVFTVTGITPVAQTNFNGSAVTVSYSAFSKGDYETVTTKLTINGNDYFYTGELEEDGGEITFQVANADALASNVVSAVVSVVGSGTGKSGAPDVVAYENTAWLYQGITNGTSAAEWFKTWAEDTTVQKTNGSWSKEPTAKDSKIVISENDDCGYDDYVFTPNLVTGQVAVVDMRVSFDAAQDDLADDYSGKQGALRAVTDEEDDNIFRLAALVNGAWVTNADVAVELGVEYPVRTTFNYRAIPATVTYEVATNGEYQVIATGNMKAVRSALESVTFNGTGKLAVMTGSNVVDTVDASLVEDGAGNKYANLNAALGKDGLKLLWDASWTPSDAFKNNRRDFTLVSNGHKLYLTPTDGVVVEKDGNNYRIIGSYYEVMNLLFGDSVTTNKFMYFTNAVAQTGEEYDSVTNLYLLRDVTITEALTISRDIWFNGESNVLARTNEAAITVADGKAFTIEGGNIGIPYAANIALKGGRFNVAATNSWNGHLPEGYTFAEMAMAEREGYKWQLMTTNAAPKAGEVLMPVKTAEGESVSVVVSNGWAQTVTKKSEPAQQSAVLSVKQGNGLTFLDNAILGLATSAEAEVPATQIPVIQPVQATDTDKVTFQLGNVSQKAIKDSGARVKYRVWTGTTPGAKTTASAATNSTDTIKMDLPKTGVQYYLIEVDTGTVK